MNALTIEQIKRHEGFRDKPYLDTVGKLTIGYGRNLDDGKLGFDEAELMLKNDLKQCVKDAQSFTWFNGLNQARQGVVINMIFNLGLNRFKGFKNTIAHIEAANYEQAALEMMNSKWAVQVGSRAVELSKQMASGAF